MWTDYLKLFLLCLSKILQLLDAVARLASLGFDKSYRESVVLLTRSYLSKLSNVGSAENKAVPEETNAELVEVFSNSSNVELHCFKILCC